MDCFSIAKHMVIEKGRVNHMPNSSERYQKYCRINATMSRSLYDVLANISDQMDFSQPKFAHKMKRNRSIGSALALVAELALTDDKFVERLRKFMISEGKYYTHETSYFDRY
jgi:hypothetical protein